MDAWLEFGLSNGVAATLLALVAALATRFCRRPQVVLVLWLLVLAKLLAPPIVGLPAVSLRTYLPTEQSMAPELTAFDLPSDAMTVQLPETVAPAETSGELLLAAEREFQELASQEHFDATTSLEPALETDLILTDDSPLAAQQEIPTTDAALVPSLPNWLPRSIFWTWIAGSALWFAIAAARIARFARLIRHAEPAGAALQDEVRQLAERTGVSRVPQVRVARRRLPPLVWGMSGRPTLLLPAELLETLSDEQRETLLVHELAHVARRDDLVRWFELAAIGLYWWHPVAWWARYNAEAAQEQCCDVRVMSLLPHAARAYAETLLATIEFLAEPARKVPLGASGFSQVGHMHRRLTMILKRNTTGRMSWTMTASLAALSFLVLPLSLHTLWAEPVPEGELEVAVEALESEAESAGEVELFVDVDERVVVAEQIDVEVADDDDTAKSAEAIDPAVERRLERLEQMMEKLVDRATEGDKKAGKPSTPATTKPATKSEKGQRVSGKPLPDSGSEPGQDCAELAELKKKIASSTVPAVKQSQRAAAQKMLAALVKSSAAADVLREELEAHAKELAVEEHYRMQLDKAKREMGDLEAKKAAIDMELAKEADRLQERHEELKAMYLKQRAILEETTKNNLDAEKLKRQKKEKDENDQ